MPTINATEVFGNEYSGSIRMVMRDVGYASVFDVVTVITKHTASNAIQVVNRLCRQYPEVDAICSNVHRFPGSGQRPTPIANGNELVYIVAQLPGENAKEARVALAQILARYLEADHGLRNSPAEDDAATYTIQQVDLAERMVAVKQKEIDIEERMMSLKNQESEIAMRYAEIERYKVETIRLSNEIIQSGIETVQSLLGPLDDREKSSYRNLFNNVLVRRSTCSTHDDGSMDKNV